MSYEYDTYLAKHRQSVSDAYKWIRDNIGLDKIDESLDPIMMDESIKNHDFSKDFSDEYDAYDKYFYGMNKSYKVVQDFNYAWLLHIHRNPHHWQHWILVNDDPKSGEVLMEIPIGYIVEMICDWWAFSFAKGNLNEIFDWYDEHKEYMKINPKSKKNIEKILMLIKEKLKEM